MRSAKTQHDCDSPGCEASTLVIATSPMTVPPRWAVGRQGDYCPAHTREFRSLHCPGCGHIIETVQSGLPHNHCTDGTLGHPRNSHGWGKEPDERTECPWPSEYGFSHWTFERWAERGVSRAVWEAGAKILGKSAPTQAQLAGVLATMPTEGIPSKRLDFYRARIREGRHIGSRLNNALMRREVWFVFQLAAMTRREIGAMKGVGAQALEQAESFLNHHGFELMP